MLDRVPSCSPLPTQPPLYLFVHSFVHPSIHLSSAFLHLHSCVLSEATLTLQVQSCVSCVHLPTSPPYGPVVECVPKYSTQVTEDRDVFANLCPRIQHVVGNVLLYFSCRLSVHSHLKMFEDVPVNSNSYKRSRHCSLYLMFATCPSLNDSCSCGHTPLSVTLQLL